MNEVIEEKAKKLMQRDRKHHELDDSTRSLPANTFLCRKVRQNTIQGTTSQRSREPASVTTADDRVRDEETERSKFDA